MNDAAAVPPEAPADAGPKSFFGRRLELLERLPAGAEFPLWLALDRETGTRHCLEILPATVAGGLPDWAASAASLIPPAHPCLLGFHRLEATPQGLGIVSAYDARLRRAPFGGVPFTPPDLVQALAWLEELTHAVDELHETGSRAHGAIVPSRIHLDRSAAPLLTGYPHAAYFPRPDDVPFLSPERRSGNTPTRQDDVFSLAALAYLFFTGGAQPPDPAQPLDTGIDGERQRRGLPATGWPADWDLTLLHALVGRADERPASARSWFDQLSRALGRPVLRPSRRSASLPSTPNERPRRSPPWRNPARTAGTSATPSGESPLRALARIREQSAEIAEATREQSARERQVAQQRAELEQKQQALDRREKNLAEERAAIEARRSELEKTTARQSEAERGLSAEAERLATRARELAGQAQAHEAARRSLDEERAAVKKQQGELSARAAELEARSRQIAAAEQTLSRICGGTTPAHWQAFAQRLDTAAAENARRAAALDAQQRQLQARPQPPTSDAAAVGPAEPAPTPPPPIGAVAAAPEPPPLPPVGGQGKATLTLPSGRRLHLFAQSTLRFGRHGNSDILLVAMLAGQANMALNREISRKHFELQITSDEVRVIDGWSDDRKASAHGICVDGRRVLAGGAVLKDGMILSVTTRALAKSVPHWRVRLLPASAAESGGHVTGLLLQRLDDDPDDVAAVLGTVSARELTLVDDPADQTFLSGASGLLAWQLPTGTAPLLQGPSPLPGISVASVGFCSPSVVVPNN